MKENNPGGESRFIPEKWREPAAIAVLFTIITGITYTVGWSFNVRYYEQFGIGLSTAAVPENMILVSGAYAIKENISQSIICIAASSIVSALACALYERTKGLKYYFRVATLVPIIFSTAAAMFYFSHKLGTIAGERAIRREVSDLYRESPSAFVAMKDGIGQDVGENQILKATFEEIQQGCFRLISIRQNGVFLVRARMASVQSKNDSTPPKSDFIFAPISSIQLIRTMQNVSICK